MAQRTRNNHFVPQFYLRQWQSSDENLRQGKYVYSYPWLTEHDARKKWSTCNIAHTASQHFLYTVECEGVLDNSLEDALSCLESKIPAVIAKLNDPSTLSDTDKILLMEFIAVQSVRTPVWWRKLLNNTDDRVQRILRSDERVIMRENLHNAIHNLIFPTKDLLYTKLHYIATKYDKTELVHLKRQEYPGYYDEFDEYDYLFFVSGLMLVAIGEAIRTEWYLLKAPDDCHFITCDNPVAIIQDHINWGRNSYCPWYPGDIILMPLSPEYLLVSNTFPNLWDFDKSRVDGINAIIAYNADMYVYDSFPNEAVSSLISCIVDAEECALRSISHEDFQKCIESTCPSACRPIRLDTHTQCNKDHIVYHQEIYLPAIHTSTSTSDK